MDAPVRVTDWRGTLIEAGCSVIYRMPVKDGPWRIGTVLEVARPGLAIEWAESSNERRVDLMRVSRWVAPANVTVWFTAGEMEDETEDLERDAR